MTNLAFTENSPRGVFWLYHVLLRLYFYCLCWLDRLSAFLLIFLRSKRYNAISDELSSKTVATIPTIAPTFALYIIYSKHAATYAIRIKVKLFAASASVKINVAIHGKRLSTPSYDQTVSKKHPLPPASPDIWAPSESDYTENYAPPQRDSSNTLTSPQDKHIAQYKKRRIKSVDTATSAFGLFENWLASPQDQLPQISALL